VSVISEQGFKVLIPRDVNTEVEPIWFTQGVSVTWRCFPIDSTVVDYESKSIALIYIDHNSGKTGLDPLSPSCKEVLGRGVLESLYRNIRAFGFSLLLRHGYQFFRRGDEFQWMLF